MDLPPTDPALIRDLQSQTPAKRAAAWAVFDPAYRPVILAWCRRRFHTREDLAEDLTQEVLKKLWEMFPRHYYDPDRGRFHSWLYAVVRNVLNDYSRREAGRPDGDGVGGTDHLGVLAGLEGPEAAAELSRVIGSQPATRTALALARVKASVSERDWKVFFQRFAENRPAAEIAAEMGLSGWNVLKIAQRVRKLLLEESRDE
jgi:RNA polymerase sigma factor (sigma-70 family)